MFIPHDFERYPHVHYNEVDLPHIMEEIKILKDWSKTLTELHLKLQEMHNEDYSDTIEEIQSLIDKINGWIEILTQEFSEYFKGEKEYSILTTSAIDRLNALIYTISELIETLKEPFSELFNCIENRLQIFDKYFRNLFPRVETAEKNIENLQSEIEKINSYISNIYEVLEGLITEGAEKSTLIYGTDYSLTWYNNFYPLYGNSNAPEITENLITLKTPNGTFYTATIDFLIDSNHWVTNSTTASSSSAPQFSHGTSYVNATNSWIYGVKLNNSKLKHGNLLSSQEISTGIWNMSPTSQRASWSVKVNTRLTDDDEFIFNMVSIADGYNTQYSVYSGLSFGQLNMHHQAIFEYE